MGHLHNLPDTDGKPREAFFFKNAEGIKKSVMKNGGAYTTAGDNGAINIWIDNNGIIRGELMRRFVTVDSKQWDFMRDAKPVIDNWINDIR